MDLENAQEVRRLAERAEINRCVLLFLMFGLTLGSNVFRRRPSLAQNIGQAETQQERDDRTCHICNPMALDERTHDSSPPDIKQYATSL